MAEPAVVSPRSPSASPGTTSAPESTAAVSAEKTPSPESAPSPEPPPAPRGLTRQDVFSALGALGAVLTLVTTVLFYFGWRRSDVQATAMGIDVSLFGFSTQDYVLRSISSLYLPLLVLLGLGLVSVWLHQRVTRLLTSTSPRIARRREAAATWTGRFAAALVGLAATCVVFMAAAGLDSPPWGIAWLASELAGTQWVVPLVLVLATVMAAYLRWVHRQLKPRSAAVSLPLWQTLLPTAMAAGIVLLGGFWMLEEYASAVGRGRAEEVARNVERLPRATVLSPSPLGITAPGVQEESIGTPGKPDAHYRTTGLRLLARSGGKVLLVPDGWSPQTGTVIVLPDADSLGWEFSR
jgi:hypothetical protein